MILVNSDSFNPIRHPILKKKKNERMITKRTGKEMLKRLMPSKTSSGKTEMAYKIMAAKKRIMSRAVMVNQKAFPLPVKLEINFK
jgi:uncharacterized protein YpmS